ncbi:TetR/AcrR family transcriptional regulator [Nocardiopsis nanhaiensis]
MTMEQRKSREQRTRERREERAEHILDVTKELVLRWGYRKTTLDDIARNSQVSKGTLFLHWRNRDALFASLLRRERLGILTDVEDAFRRDPDQASLYGLVRLFVRMFHSRPLLTALMLGDQSTLGRLADRRKDEWSASERAQSFLAYLEELRASGLVRDDVPTEELVYSFTAVFYGYVAARPTTPEDRLPSEERVADLCADTICRALAPSAGADRREELDEITRRYVAQALEITRTQYLASLTAPASAEEA